LEADLFFRIVAFIVLMFLSACFSASETAFFSLSRVRVQTLKRESMIGRRIASLLERPRRLIISILMGNEIVNIAASSIFTGAMVVLLEDRLVWLIPILMTILLNLFGEITPKSIAARIPERMSWFLALPIFSFTKLIFPIRWVVLVIANAVLALIGGRNRVQGNILMEDEYLTLVEAGVEEGELDATEKAYIKNIFEFHDRTVGEITVPRTDMKCWQSDLPMSEVIKLVRSAPHSRIPIYQGDRDHILGILYVKDFLRLSQQEEVVTDQPLAKELLRKPLYVPEGMKLDALFRQFRQGRTHMAIVADEYGGVAGLVTMTDLLEEIFGEIRDEHSEFEYPEIERQEDGSYLCQARLQLWDFTEKTGWSLPGDLEVNTVGGLVFNLAGQIPNVGARVYYGEIAFTVLEMESTRVRKVRAEKSGKPF
jgi:putative hemolysin